jgi:hypothetical protein
MIPALKQSELGLKRSKCMKLSDHNKLQRAGKVDNSINEL